MDGWMGMDEQMNIWTDRWIGRLEDYKAPSFNILL